MALCPYLSASLLIFICIYIIIAQFGIVNVFFQNNPEKYTFFNNLSNINS